jgi:hypothetical protein
MDDKLTEKQPPMAKKERKFEPGRAMPFSLIGTAGINGSRKNKRNIERTIKCAADARRRDQKKD